MQEFTGPDKVTYPVYDVTGHRYGEDIDFNLLDVVHTAPAWLSSAERLILFALIYSIRPRRYLEIGILHGGASLIVAKAMDAVGHDGQLILIDNEPKVSPEHWQQMKHRSVLVEGWSPEILTEAREVANGPFDFVFIDAGHSKNAVMRDANGVFRYLEDGAYILFHDSYRWDVNQAIDRFVQMHISSVVDFGLLTREFTSQKEESNNVNKKRMSCGFRLVQLRKHHGKMRIVNKMLGFRAYWEYLLIANWPKLKGFFKNKLSSSVG